MSVEYRVCDVFDGLADLEDGSIDLIVTSPPFLALRSYLPADHPDKGKEIGSEKTPAEFLDVMLRLSAEFRRVLAPHGSLCVELGDTYAGPQPPFRYTDAHSPDKPMATGDFINHKMGESNISGRIGDGWPLAKSKTLIPQLFEVALAYGFNPLTGEESPAGKWRVRNVVTWARPNPPVGALGDKWRPATSDIVVACVSDKRFWDDLATRRPFSDGTVKSEGKSRAGGPKFQGTPGDGLSGGLDTGMARYEVNLSTHSGAPLLDYWVIPPGGYPGSHYAVYPPELVVPLVKAMCPQRVCRECGEPSRPILGEPTYVQRRNGQSRPDKGGRSLVDHSVDDYQGLREIVDGTDQSVLVHRELAGFTDCGHDDWRTGRVLDPFAGSGTTLMVAHGHGFDAIGFDLDERNLELARERVGPMFFQELV